MSWVVADITIGSDFDARSSRIRPPRTQRPETLARNAGPDPEADGVADDHPPHRPKPRSRRGQIVQCQEEPGGDCDGAGEPEDYAGGQDPRRAAGRQNDDASTIVAIARRPTRRAHTAIFQCPLRRNSFGSSMPMTVEVKPDCRQGPWSSILHVMRYPSTTFHAPECAGRGRSRSQARPGISEPLAVNEGKRNVPIPTGRIPPLATGLNRTQLGDPEHRVSVRIGRRWLSCSGSTRLRSEQYSRPE